MSQLISKRDATEIRRIFGSRLRGAVTVLLFTSKRACAYCPQTAQLLREVAALDERVRLEVRDIDEEPAKAREFGVELAPTTVIVASNGTRLYYVGMPSGRQLGPLVEDMADASAGGAEMDDEVRAVIGKVAEETVIKVFVTPSCAYSPLVVRSAHRFAMENPKIRAMMIESIEFPDLASKYNVVGVPRTVINDRVTFDGSPSEKEFARIVLEASKQTS